VIADLQKRPVALEGKAAEKKSKATSGEKYSVTTQQAAQEIVKPIDGNREQNEKSLQKQTTTNTTYVQLKDADTKIKKLEAQAKAFEFHGYLRSGYGLKPWGPASGLPSSWRGSKVPPGSAMSNGKAKP
jgi:maltoporin